MASNPQPRPPARSEDVDEAGIGAEPSAAVSDYRWHHKLFSLLGVIFCFEMGVFLLVFPWVSAWDSNYFARLPLWAHDVWVSPYFRGAISGLGLVNIYISFLEVLRLRRFS